ncbi:hypothetical protein HJ588_02095 [Flexivirga sp. ID2601S]|uniref:Uncharacterized protein n=1 Tax=Flexivirga aerilata TaxID=1656889 RepID=A0A849AER4_9MICO|nr:hypothetical protein [Flexivirga aerilata]NNG38066.1 hypothetical protein [Flexivirga aerilata]
MSVFVPHAPMLNRLFELQQADDAAIGHESLDRIARRVLQLAEAFENPLVVPVGDSAQRVLGAITLISRGTVEVSTWTCRVASREVLLVGTVAATTIEFETVAGILRSRGASGIYACALHVDTLDPLRDVDTLELIDSPIHNRLTVVDRRGMRPT